MGTMTQTSESQHRPRSLSGIQATSDSLHLGNYIGAPVSYTHLTLPTICSV